MKTAEQRTEPLYSNTVIW